DFVSGVDSVLAKPRYAAIPTLTAVAAVTDRIELTTGILQPHLRPPVQLTHECATVDSFGGGPAWLRVGLGTEPRELLGNELALVGLSRRRRARAFEESIILLRKLWSSEGPCSFDGRVYRLAGVDVGFRPVRAGGVPVLIACGAYVPLQAGFGPHDVYRSDVAGAHFAPPGPLRRAGDGRVTGHAPPPE